LSRRPLLLASYTFIEDGLCASAAQDRLLGIVAMLVESASLDTVSTLVYIITVGINSPLQNVFLPVLGQVQVRSSIVVPINSFKSNSLNLQVIAPMLIFYRVAHGRDAVTESIRNGNSTTASAIYEAAYAKHHQN
jgi:hypothetical protein